MPWCAEGEPGVLGRQRLISLRSGQSLAGPAVLIAVEAMYVVLPAAAGPGKVARLSLPGR